MPQILLDFTHAAHNKLTLVPVTARRKAFIILGVQGMDPAIQKQGSRLVFHSVSAKWNFDEWAFEADLNQVGVSGMHTRYQGDMYDST